MHGAMVFESRDRNTIATRAILTATPADHTTRESDWMASAFQWTVCLLGVE